MGRQLPSTPPPSVHNFSLRHDDVIDNDRTRRHRPTAWRAFGLGGALLTGMLFSAWHTTSWRAGGTRRPAAEARC